MKTFLKTSLATTVLLVTPIAANAANAGVVGTPAGVNSVVFSGASSLNEASITTDTVVHFSRIALKQFHKGEFDKAERSFEAVLRADPKNAFAARGLAVINQQRDLG